MPRRRSLVTMHDRKHASTMNEGGREYHLRFTFELFLQRDNIDLWLYFNLYKVANVTARFSFLFRTITDCFCYVYLLTLLMNGKSVNGLYSGIILRSAMHVVPILYFHLSHKMFFFFVLLYNI